MPALNLRTIVPALAALATASAVHAQRYVYVDASAPAGGDGTSWNTAFRDLQDGLDTVDPDRDFYIEFHVAQGIYTPDRGTGDRDMAFSLASGVVLMGGYAGFSNPNPNLRDPNTFVSVLSGDLQRDDLPNFGNSRDNSKQIIRTSNNTFGYVIGFTISGANADEETPVRYSGSVLGSPPGCYPCSAHLVIRHCKIVGNAIHAPHQALIAGEIVVIENTLIAGNTISVSGWENGLIVSRNPYIASSRIIGNNTGVSPIIYVRGNSYDPGVHVIHNSIISSNRGLPVTTNTATRIQINNCTFVDNVSEYGNVIYVPSDAAARITLANSILYGNRDRFSGPVTQIEVRNTRAIVDFYSSVNLVENGSDSVSSPGDVFASLNPAFVDDPRLRSSAGADGNPYSWQDNDYRLRVDSPCIDTASSWVQFFEPNDIDGTPPFDVFFRYSYGIGPINYRDLGAIELVLCAADFDLDDSVTSQDVFAFITAWFNNAQNADLDHDFRVTIQDLFAFLNAWFAGCPNT